MNSVYIYRIFLDGAHKIFIMLKESANYLKYR